MLIGVVAMVMVKVVVAVCWICLASARNGMIWPCAMMGTITMCLFFFVSSAIGSAEGENRTKKVLLVI